MQIPVSSSVAPHYSRQGTLMTQTRTLYTPPAQQADIDMLVAYHKSVREHNDSLNTGKDAPAKDDKPRTIKRDKKRR